jgi:NAD(P)-dependent dehydrogenase (short-subunit alcohol dehydrogenase family)
VSHHPVAVVTGGGSGIGEATTRRLVERGYRVLMVGRNGARLRAAQADIEGLRCQESTALLAVDITNDGAAEAIVDAAIDQWGHLDTLVHAAGVSRPGEIATASLVDFDATFALNVRAPFALTKAAVPQLKPGSSIVFVSSHLTQLGKPAAAAYSASKGAIESLVKTLAVELGAVGIRVNAVSPGPTNTNMAAASFSDRAELERLVAMSPIGHLGEPDDIAQAIVFLASDAARYINGAAVLIDGGRSLT